MPDLVEERTRRDRDRDRVRRLPAELLGDLERERLRALRVVRAQVDVDEPPRKLERQLDGEARAVVVGAVDRIDAWPVDRGGGELLRLEVARNEDRGLHPLGCRPRCHGARQVAGRGAGERIEAELLRLASRDRNDPVLERMRRVGGVELEPELADPELRREARSRDEWRHPGCEARIRGCVDGQEIGIAPDRRGACLDRRAADRRAEQLPVIGRVERAEALRAASGRLEWVLGRADAAAKGYGGHWAEPPGRRSTSVRVWHLTRYVGQVAEASQGRSLSLSRCGAGRVPRRRPV